MRRALGVAAFALALAGGCGDGSDEPETPSAQTSVVPSTTSPPKPTERTAEVVTNDGARLRITLAVGGQPVGSAEACAAGLPAGTASVPVTLTVMNLGDRTAPFPPLRLETTAADGAEQRTSVRAATGECSPFPRLAPLEPGQATVLTGSTPGGAGRLEVRISETDFVLTVPRP